MRGGVDSRGGGGGMYSMRPWDRHASRVSFREKHARTEYILYISRHHTKSEKERDRGWTKAEQRIVREKEGRLTMISRGRKRRRNSRAYNVCRLQECHYVSFARVRSPTTILAHRLHGRSPSSSSVARSVEDLVCTTRFLRKAHRDCTIISVDYAIIIQPSYSSRTFATRGIRREDFPCWPQRVISSTENAQDRMDRAHNVWPRVFPSIVDVLLYFRRFLRHDIRGDLTIVSKYDILSILGRFLVTLMPLYPKKQVISQICNSVSSASICFDKNKKFFIKKKKIYLYNKKISRGVD